MGDGLAPCPAGALRPSHRIPLPGFSFLREGVQVRIMEDAGQLRILCGRCAPGAKETCGWNSEMKAFAGQVFTVFEINDVQKSATTAISSNCCQARASALRT